MVQTLERQRSGIGEAVQPRERNWTLLSARGQVLFHLAQCPGATVNEIALAMHLTPRAVWINLRTMRVAGTVSTRRSGRVDRYYINLDAPLFVPAVDGLTLRALVGQIASQGAAAAD